jgi:protein phosphatase 1L
LKNKLIQLDFAAIEFLTRQKLNQIEVSIATTRGKRKINEDTYVAAKISIQGEEHPFLAIFDGHGGTLTANYLAKNIQQILQYQLSLLRKKLSEATPYEIENILTVVPVKAEQERRQANPTDHSSGATFHVAIFINNRLYLANAGDSRTLALQGKKTIQLTEDASPEVEPFKHGVEKRGGYVSEHRVANRLAVARTVGDVNVEGSSPRAKITWLDVDQETVLIMGCDGLFASTVAQMIADEYREKKTAVALLQKSYTRGSCDNITCIIAKIPSVEKNPTTELSIPKPLSFSLMNEWQKKFLFSATLQHNLIPLSKYIQGETLPGDYTSDQQLP